MSEVLNGQIVPALSQWQGASLIVTALVVSCLVRQLRRMRGLSRH
jgi:hypothetical protein